MSQEEQSRELQKLQLLWQQLIVLQERLELLKRRYEEVTFALEELRKLKEKGETEAYKFIGSNILIRRSIDELISELEDEKVMLEQQIKLIEQQVSTGKKELEKLAKKAGLLQPTESKVAG